MQTLYYTTNGGYDSIIMTTDDGRVIGRWTVGPREMQDYLAAIAQPATAEEWDAHNDDPSVDLDQFAAVAEFGTVVCAVSTRGVEYPEGKRAFDARAEFFRTA